MPTPLLASLALALAACSRPVPVGPRAAHASSRAFARPASAAPAPPGTSPALPADAPPRERDEGRAPFVVTDACIDPVGLEPLVHHRPPCEFPAAAYFWRWPGNILVVPSEAGLGSCHDEDIWFPAPAATCEPSPIARVERGAARGAAGAVVQVGGLAFPVALDEPTLAAVERMRAPRLVLALRLHGAFDPAALAPLAPRLVGLFIYRYCVEEECGTPLELARLPVMPELRSLEIAYGGEVRGVASLARHPRLAGLGLDADLHAPEAAAIEALPALTHLRLAGEHPRALRALSALRELHVTATDRNLRALAAQRRLETLVLRGPVSDRGLAAVARIHSLRRLSVGLDGYGDAGARGLRAARLGTLLVRARGRDAEAVTARLAALGGLARHPTATVLLDIDEDLSADLAEPWRTVTCRADPERCRGP